MNVVRCFFVSLRTVSVPPLRRMIWREINGKNLRENIEPTRSRAGLLLRKGADHRVTDVSLRRL